MPWLFPFVCRFSLKLTLESWRNKSHNDDLLFFFTCIFMEVLTILLLIWMIAKLFRLIIKQNSRKEKVKLFFSSFPSLIFFHYVRCKYVQCIFCRMYHFCFKWILCFSSSNLLAWVSFQKERLVASPFLAERRENRALGRISLMTSIVTGKWKSGNKFSSC